MRQHRDVRVQNLEPQHSEDTRPLVLVTGGAGYAGAVTVRELLFRGYRVRVFDKLLYGTFPLDECAHQIDIVQGDICEMDASVLDGVDAVIHLAGLSNDSTAEFNPEANRQINTEGTRMVAQAGKEKGVERFIFASTCSVYDTPREEKGVLQDENSPLAPHAAYGRSKLEAERVLLDMAGENFRPIILRQGTIYGHSPRMRYDLVVNTFVKCAFQTGRLEVHCGGEIWRPVIDVTDMAKCYVACLEAPIEDVGGQVINIADKNYRILELAHQVAKALEGIVHVELDVDYEPRNVRDYRVSTTKMHKLLRFRPVATVEQSARDMAAKIQDNVNADLENPKYYNIRWLELLIEMKTHLDRIGNVF